DDDINTQTPKSPQHPPRWPRFRPARWCSPAMLFSILTVETSEPLQPSIRLRGRRRATAEARSRQAPFSAKCCSRFLRGQYGSPPQPQPPLLSAPAPQFPVEPPFSIAARLHAQFFASVGSAFPQL